MTGFEPIRNDYGEVPLFARTLTTDDVRCCVTCGAIVDATVLMVHVRWHEGFDGKFITKQD